VRGWSLRFQIAQQPLKCLLVGGRIGPIREVRDEVLADVSRKVLFAIRIEALPSPHFLVTDKPDREENATTLADLALTADRPNKNRFPRAPPAAGSAQFPIIRT
jgi:hypothetical protein